ncbi:MAG: DUF2142 domain-containing protein [Bifidobacteriaceae bacterium]|nr:DUF2142 domain-containing protein [Bifidobacteriaceae bacterium]
MKPAKIFSILALISSILFIIFTPPGFNDDEPTHYIRVQQIANGQFFNQLKPYPAKEGDKRTAEQRLIGYGPIDQNAKDFINSYHFGKTYSLPFDNFLNAPQKYHSDKILDITSGQATPNSPFTYLPLVAGVELAKTLNLSLLNEFMLAKLLETLVCIFLTTLAIRFIPRGKWILFAISILPMTIVQFTAFSHDGLTYAVSVLLFSFTYKIIYEKSQINWQNVNVLAILTIALGTMKMTYLPIIALTLLIPILNKHWQNIKGWLICVLSSLASVITCFGLIQQVNKANVDITIGPNTLSPDLQKQAILHNPLNLIKAAFNTIFYQPVDPNSYLHSRQQLNIFGVLEADKVFLQPWFMVASITAIILAIIITMAQNQTAKSWLGEVSLTKKSRTFQIARWLIPIACLVLTYLALYLAINPVFIDTKMPSQNTYIWGAQTRYWLPFMPLLLLPQYAKFKLDKKTVNWLILSIVALSSITLLDATYTIIKTA